MISISYPHPRNDDDFESFCLDLFRAERSSTDIQRNGRRGHRQNGVDIFGHDKDGELFGIQCKLHSPPHVLTEKEIREEVKKAKTFDPPLRSFLFATTSKRDPELQRLARALTKNHRKKKLFSVHVYSWDDLSELLRNHPTIAEQLLGPAVLATYTHQRERVDRLIALVEGNRFVDGGHGDIDSAASLLRKSPVAAESLLQQIRTTKWHVLDSRGRFRVLANLGFAASALNRPEDAARLFIEAKGHQPDDDRAQALETLGYLHSGNQAKAFELASSVLKSHPMQVLAASVLVRAAPPEVGMRDVVEMVPELLRKEPDVAVALAARARMAGDFDAALAHLSPALEREPAAESVVEELGRATLGSLFGRTGVPTSIPLVVHERQLRELLARIDAGIAALSVEASASEARLLLLRAAVHERLGNTGAAKADVTRAYALDPQNEEAAMQHALDEHAQGRAQQAFEVLRKSAAPSNRILLAKYLRELGDKESRKEAIATLRSLREKLSGDDSWLRRMWANELVTMLAENGEADEGFAVLESLPPTFVGKVTKSLLQAALYHARGDRPSELVSVKEALKALAADTPWDEQRRLALQLQSVGLFELASDVWRRVVVPTSLREDVFNYLHCAQRADKDKQVLDFCKSARIEGVWLPELVSAELSLYEKYNAKSQALEVARDFLKSASDDAAVRVQIALVAVRAGEQALASELQARLPSAKEAEPNIGRAVVEILRGLGNFAEAATYAYELAGANPDAIDAHKAVLVSFGLDGVPPPISSPSRVEVGTAIRYREDDTGKEEWCVIESEHAAVGGGEVIGSGHPLVAELVGKEVGESFVLRRSQIQERRGTVLEIVDKRVWRFRDSMEKWERRFPDDVSLQKFVIPDEGELETRLAPMFRVADLRAESQQEGLQLYRSGRVPLYLLSKVMGGTLFESTLGVAGLPDTPIHTCAGNGPERSASTEAFLNAKGLVLDATALATLFLTGTDEVLEATKVPLLISEGTLDELRSSEILTRAEGEPLARLGRIDGKYRLTEMSPEHVLEQKKKLQAFTERVSKACEIVPGLALASIDAPRREQLILLLGRPLAESAAVARERGCVLWTDDQLAAVVAGELVGCKRVWSQAVFDEEARAGEIPQTIYAKLVTGLFDAGYRYTWLTPELVLLIGQLSDWNFGHSGFDRALCHFADPNVNASSLGVLTLKTLRLLWSGQVLEELAQAVTVRIGANILKRPDGSLLLEAIKTNLRKAFGINVLGEARVSALLAVLGKALMR